MEEKTGRDAWLEGMSVMLAEEGELNLSHIEAIEVLDVVWAAVRHVEEAGMFEDPGHSMRHVMETLAHYDAAKAGKAVE